MRPSPDVTRAFLLWLYPTGPWTLTAISVSKKEIASDTCNTIESAMSFVEDHAKFNLYYSVNQPTREASGKKKFGKTDIEVVHFLHVDVDPRAGADIAAEQDRILTQILAYRTPPSAIIFSGGGYNALWRLTDPVQLTASTPEEHIRNAIEVERRNWQFELDFSTPDHCRDISRILRLPGTINWPSAEKVAKGRTPALAVIHATSDVTYPIAHFMATPVAPVNATTSATKVSQDLKRIESIDELEVPEKLKKVIVQGFDPDDRAVVKSRSEWLFYACCEMVRCNVPDEVIHGVITDSRFSISESVLDKGSGITRYALRQISRARDASIHPRLLEMNDKFAVVENYGNRCVVMRETGDGQLSFQGPREFFSARASSHIITKDAKGREVLQSDGKWWFHQARRRQYERVVFDPSGDSPGSYNTFRGFAVQPADGVKHQGFLHHVRANICAGVQEYSDYLIRWMARVVQQPKTQSEVAIVLVSRERGTGKSFFCRQFLDLFGSHGAVVDNMDHLIGRFNSHLADKILVVAEEAYHAYDRRNESVLKELITGKRRAIERKGYDVFWGENYAHLMMTSNNERVVPAGDHERRFLVLRVGTDKTQDSAYFGRIAEDMDAGGRANLMHHLLSVDLSDFDVRSVPKTQALVEQQMLNLSREHEWLLDKLHIGIWLNARPTVRWEGPVVKSLLYEDYQEYMRQRNQFVMSVRVWHDWFLKQIPSARSTQLGENHAVEGGSVRPMAFLFPPLTACRKDFQRARNWPTFQWDEPLFVHGVHDKESSDAELRLDAAPHPGADPNTDPF